MPVRACRVMVTGIRPLSGPREGTSTTAIGSPMGSVLPGHSRISMSIGAAQGGKLGDGSR